MGIWRAKFLTDTKLTHIQQLHLLQNELSPLINDNESLQRYMIFECIIA